MKNTNNIKIFSIIVLAGGLLLFAASLVLGAIILPLNDRSLIWNCFASYWTAPAFLFGIAFAIVGCFTLCFGKTVAKHCSPLTSLDAFGLSMFGAMGFLCFLCLSSIALSGKPSAYPRLFPCSLSLGIVALLAVLALVTVYVVLRKKGWSIIGVLLDFLTMIIFFVPFFASGRCAMALLSLLLPKI